MSVPAPPRKRTGALLRAPSSKPTRLSEDNSWREFAQSCRQIPLTKGEFALVDQADFDWLNGDDR